ncbi:hypothetical protein BV22DRAFT_1052831, partial [Leucogyrophana mollusca]
MSILHQLVPSDNIKISKGKKYQVAEWFKPSFRLLCKSLIDPTSPFYLGLKEPGVDSDGNKNWVAVTKISNKLLSQVICIIRSIIICDFLRDSGKSKRKVKCPRLKIGSVRYARAAEADAIIFSHLELIKAGTLHSTFDPLEVLAAQDGWRLKESVHGTGTRSAGHTREGADAMIHGTGGRHPLARWAGRWGRGGTLVLEDAASLIYEDQRCRQGGLVLEWRQGFGRKEREGLT